LLVAAIVARYRSRTLDALARGVTALGEGRPYWPILARVGGRGRVDRLAHLLDTVAPQIETRFAPSPAHTPALLGLALTLSLWFGVVVATTTLGLALSLLVTAPLLERLSRKVEAQLGGRGAGRVPSERWDFALSMRTGLVFVGTALAALCLATVPLVGPFLSAGLSAPLLAYQAMDPTLVRRDMAFAQKKFWHLRWRAEVVGFGLAALIALLVPIVNAFLPPALAVGATRLVLDLEALDAEQGQASPAPDSDSDPAETVGL